MQRQAIATIFYLFHSSLYISTFFYKHLSRLCQNINLIIKARQQQMELVLNYKSTLDELNESDQEALDLFNNLNPGDSNPQPAEPEQMLNQSDDESMPHFHKLHKLKKSSKQDQKKQKKKDKKKHKKSNPHAHLMQDATPKKKHKKEGSSKKKRTAQQQGLQSGDQGSSEFDSQSDKSEDLNMELKHLNPDISEDISPKKRLRKSNKKSKIEEKQGFKITQLGLDPEIDEDKLSVDSDDDDFSSEEKKRKQRKRKAKKPVISNAEMMNAFKEQGLVESEGQERQANYDNGLDMLHSMKDKKKNGIKINNRMFGDLDIDLRDEQAFMPPPENLQLELKPKSSTISSHRFSFLSKAENIKKQRGLEADVDMVEYERKASQKAKKSIAKVVSSMVSQQFHDQIDIEIRLPAVARGKSSDIINNTVFLKRFMSKNQNFEKEEIPNILPQSKSYSQPYNRRQSVSRQELFKQIQQQTRLRRSKYISDEQLKNSFKKTNLQELEEARKRIQQKKRKEALSEHDSDEQNDQELNMDSELNEMIRKEEDVCGEGEDNQEEIDGDKDSKEELNIQINIEELQQEQNDKKTPAKASNEQDEQNQPNSDNKPEQINEFNEIIDELASASEQAHLRNEEEDLIDEQEQQQQQEQMEEQSATPAKEKLSKDGDIAPEMYMVNLQREQQLRELEDEGILMRKRRRVNKRQDTIQQENPIQASTLKEYQVNISNANPMAQKQSTKKQNFLEDDEDNIEQFNNFKKLRKIAIVIANKKKLREKGRRYAQQFIENEAEQGSDNQQHDDMIKNIDYDAEQKQYEGMDLDQDLVELIDNAVDINQQDEHEAFRKYLEDVRMQDRDEIKKIIRGEFKKKHEDLELQVEEDERKRKERMDEVMNWMKKREEDDGEGIYLKEPEQPELDSNEDSEFGERKKEPVVEEPEEDSQQMPIEEQNAKLQKFLQDIVLTTTKREYKPSKLIDLGPLPESVKLQKSNSGRTISMSRFGGSSNEPKIATNKVKKTSSLINQILNKRTTTKFGHSALPTSKSHKK